MTEEKHKNIEQKSIWGSECTPDMDIEYNSCIGYVQTPGWNFLNHEILNCFKSFNDLNTIELGCGLGKVSLLFSILGSKTILLDYSVKQLSSAKFIHEKFDNHPEVIEGNLLDLPESLYNRFDISMSFGTAEHFFGKERSLVFESHYKVLKKGGISIIWVPNKYCFLFHLGRNIRKCIGKSYSKADETPFTRKELYKYAQKAGFKNIKIQGGTTIASDFNRSIINLPAVPE